MKYQLTAIVLAIVLACSGCGSGGQQETESQTQVQADSIGGVYVDPIAHGSLYQAPAGTDTVSLYVEREGAEPGEGVFTLYEADGTVAVEIPAGSSQVTFSPITEEHKEYYGMDAGTEIHISLGFGLEAGGAYYAELSEDFVRWEGISSKALGGSDAWPIHVAEEKETAP